MTKSADPKRHGRRSFLRGVAGAGAATTAFVLSGGAGAEDVRSAEEDRGDPASERKGYRETSHIKTYYDKARF